MVETTGKIKIKEFDKDKDKGIKFRKSSKETIGKIEARKKIHQKTGIKLVKCMKNNNRNG